MLPAWSHDELLHVVMVAPRRAFVPNADTEVRERPGWLEITTPSFHQGGLNEVVHSALEEADADAVIDETIARYRSRGLRFRWVVGPGSRPADLAERLARRGLRSHETHGMARDTGRAPTPPDADVTVEEVDGETVDEFTRVMAAGWGVDPAPLDPYHRLMLAHPGRSHRLFLARHRGLPAGAASLAALERSVYLIGAVVDPAFRGRGLYRALVDLRLRHAAEHGIPLATTHARAETSAPILERLGFVTVCQYPVFSID